MKHYIHFEIFIYKIMKHMHPFRFAVTALFSYILVFSSCDTSPDGPTDTFDRGAMLQNFADNLIRPAYNDLNNRTLVFHTAITTFNSAPTIENLDAMQAAWQDAYYQWQFANAFNFGPAGEEGLQKSLIEEIGTFPASVVKLEANLHSGTWNVADFNRDARGFPAIEYLIFGSAASDAAIVDSFLTAPHHKAYLAALADNLKSRIETVVNAWNGAYYTEFVNNKGTDVGSSTSHLYNEFVRSFEAAKNFKLGLPLGKRPGQTQTEPQLVEAVYSGKSLECLRLHLTAIENIWYGRSKSGQDGIGFREYLEKVEGGPALITSTETQLAALRAALAAVSDTPTLSEQITAGNPQLETLYTEFQKMTRYFKSDLSSLLGLAITFSSGDGD
ncbi:MAG: imelysin family protein [Saprospiraceae bacterium]|nr:imelysin family protein [Saprospiraceae bacterium]